MVKEEKRMHREANPNMIILARCSRGYTQKMVSEMLGVTQGIISKIEQGILAVSDELLNKLIKRLDYPMSFYFEPTYIYPPLSPFHRKRKALTKRLQSQIEAEGNIRRIHVYKLMQASEIDDSKIFYQDLDEYNITPEETAQQVRSYWNLPRGPIKNLTEVIEDSGIIVIQCDFRTFLMDGFSFNIEGIPPIILINMHIPGDRLRFTLAHELGHIIMHKIPTSTMEDEANRFASELLMPSDEIKPYLVNLNLLKLADLKIYWKVAMAALIKRSTDLNTITHNQSRYLWMQMSRAGYRRKEPVDIHKESPSLLQELIDLHRYELRYTTDELSELLLCSKEEYNRLYMGRRLRLVK